jgi:hypothetical protein
MDFLFHTEYRKLVIQVLLGPASLSVKLAQQLSDTDLRDILDSTWFVHLAIMSGRISKRWANSVSVSSPHTVVSATSALKSTE